MVFSDTSTKQGIIQEIDFLVGTNSGNYSTNDKTRNVNRGLDRIAYLIQTADGRWDWEDTNNTDLPIATTNIVANQQDYGIDTTFLKVKEVFYYENGNWEKLKHSEDKEKFLKITSTDTGEPTEYCIIGNSIMLDVYPDSNVTAGLKVYFARSVHYFETTDTTESAGFNPQFHRLLSLYGAYDWAIAKEPQKATWLKNEISTMEKALQDFYSKRDQTENYRFINSGLNTNDYK
jgi:hypothetical protein